jgi:hypothetical protein
MNEGFSSLSFSSTATANQQANNLNKKNAKKRPYYVLFSSVFHFFFPKTKKIKITKNHEKKKTNGFIPTTTIKQLFTSFNVEGRSVHGRRGCFGNGSISQ